MNVFVDTSALLALLDGDDERHDAAVETWDRLATLEPRLLTTNYVVVETLAVSQHRLGIGAVRGLVRDVLPAIEIVFVNETQHDAGVAALLAAGRRRLSLVDCVSFEVMRRLDVGRAFAYDRHFAEQGFDGPL